MTNIADTPDDLEEGQDGEGAKSKSRLKLNLKFGKKQIIMFAAGGVAMMGLAGGAYYYMGGTPEEVETQAVKPAVFVDLPDMMVNLTAPADRPKYLKLKIALEVSGEQVSEQVKPLLPRVIDSFQTHLREMRAEDFEGSAGMYRLKEELLRRINQAVYPAKVDSILFKEILVQ